jgi:hypothetical protein
MEHQKPRCVTEEFANTPHSGYYHQMDNIKMNPIQRFVHQNKPLSLSVLLNAFFRLSILQMTQGSLCFTDIRSSLEIISTNNFEEDVQTVYAGMLYETILITCLTDDGPKLCMIEEVVGKQKEFLECLLARIEYYQRKFNCDRIVSSSLEDLENNIHKLLNKQDPGHAASVSSQTPTLSSSEDFSLSMPFPAATSRHTSAPSHRESEENELHRFYDKRYDSMGMTDVNELQFPSDQIQTEYKTQQVVDNSRESPLCIIQPQLTESSSSRNDPINQLLAHIRKSGMDVLSPQVVHDKVRRKLYFLFVSSFSFSRFLPCLTCSTR